MKKEEILKEIILTVRPASSCELWEIRNQLSQFVLDNWELLYLGASRLNKNIPGDYYARNERIQIGDTRLCECRGVKYANGHKYNCDSLPSETQLKKTIKDIQSLIDSAAAPSRCSFRLEIVEL
jgi:hypothetical protein